MLLDHWEKLYLNDFQVLEELGVIGRGSVVFSDNIVRAPRVFGVCEGWEGKVGSGNEE